MRKIFVSLVLTFVCCGAAQSTVIVVIILPNSILVGSDGAMVDRTISVDGSQTTSSEKTRKIFVLNGRFAIASVGLSTMTLPDGRKVYDFAEWNKIIQNELSADTSVDQLVSLIENEATKTFSGFEQYVLKRGGYPLPSGHVLDTCRPLVQYIIAGNQDGVSKVFAIHFDVDYKNVSLTGPDKVDLNADPKGGRFDFSILTFGANIAISEMNNPKSYAYKQVSLICPEEMKVVRTKKPFTVEQAKRFIRVLVKIEKDIQPDEVGADTQILTITNGEKPEFETFDKELEAPHEAKHKG